MRRLDDCRTYYQPNSHRVRSTLPRAISRAPPAQPTCAMKVLTSGAHSAETLDTHPRRVRSRPYRRCRSAPARDHLSQYTDAPAALPITTIGSSTRLPPDTLTRASARKRCPSKLHAPLIRRYRGALNGHGHVPVAFPAIAPPDGIRTRRRMVHASMTGRSARCPSGSSTLR